MRRPGREAEVQPDRVADDLRREPVAGVGGRDRRRHARPVAGSPTARSLPRANLTVPKSVPLVEHPGRPVSQAVDGAAGDVGRETDPDLELGGLVVGQVRRRGRGRPRPAAAARWSCRYRRRRARAGSRPGRRGEQSTRARCSGLGCRGVSGRTAPPAQDRAARGVRQGKKSPGRRGVPVEGGSGRELPGPASGTTARAVRGEKPCPPGFPPPSPDPSGVTVMALGPSCGVTWQS